jgi:hypothetical protein
MSNAPGYKADENFASKLESLGIELQELGLTLIPADHPRGEPFRTAFAEYRRELVEELALERLPDAERADDLGSWLTKMEPKLIHLNCVQPDERMKCPVRRGDLQFCREAWEAARSAGVRFREATRHSVLTADDELDYLMGLRAAIEDYQSIVPPLHVEPSSEARLTVTAIPAIEEAETVRPIIAETDKSERYAALFLSLNLLARDRLIGKQRRGIELLIEGGGRKRIADIATDPTIDWDQPYKTGVDGFKKGIKPKLKSYGADVIVVDQELRIVFADDVPQPLRRSNQSLPSEAILPNADRAATVSPIICLQSADAPLSLCSNTPSGHVPDGDTEHAEAETL